MNNLSDYLDGPAPEQTVESAAFLEATVAENAHKDHPGMIRVEYTAFAQGKSLSAWLPLLFPYAGGEHGAFLLPEIGDRVVVAFLGENLQRPFVIGSFYPAGAKLPTQCFEESNLVRGLRTKGGVSVTVRDHQDKQKLELTTPGGLAVELDDEKNTLRLRDKDGKNTLTLDGGGNAMTIQCDGNLVLKAGACQITLDGGSGKITLSGSQLELKADQSAAVSAGTNLNLEGAVAKLEGKQTATLKGATMTQVSGGILKLN